MHASVRPPDAEPRTSAPGRRVVHLQGTVQGVGFRPYVHRLATRLGLGGAVWNADDTVVIEVEGDENRLERFVTALPIEAPPAARIEAMEVHAESPRGVCGFRIVTSVASTTTPSETRIAPIAPDLATCEDCWREFHDPADRRYRYPFLNCTQCGPRFTIVTGVPYDRERTTMRRFVMCDACRREYEDPGHRRFHAEPNACPECGPQLAWHVPAVNGHSAAGASMRGEQALREALAVLRGGGVIAAKGIGGYHLLCDALNADAVAKLRLRKRRPHKPLAVLVDSLTTLRAYADVSARTAALLQTPAHPIVLVPLDMDGSWQRFAEEVAPGLDQVGVMLPAFPLHALLAADGPLVCTSGNLSDEPMAWSDGDAVRRLAPLVDGFLMHDREIVVSCDDSVVQLARDGSERPVRRSRGYAPYPIDVGRTTRAAVEVIAVGAELKSTAALFSGGRITLSSHVGDVGSPETIEALAMAVQRLEAMHGGTVRVMACDMHPGYLSAHWAVGQARARSLPLVRVQHHHAHLASLLGEHGLPGDEPILAFTFDGTGYGPDGTVWGGEALLGDCTGYQRMAALASFPLAGGDAAVKQPVRSALGLLHGLGFDVTDDSQLPCGVREHVTPASRVIMQRQFTRGIATVESSSMGRLLDACAVLCGGPTTISYEGQAAVWLEVLGRRHRHRKPRYHCVVCPADDTVADRSHAPRWIIDPAPMIRALLDDVRQLEAMPEDASRESSDRAEFLSAIAWSIHAAIAGAIVTVARLVNDRMDMRRVGLTGGVFQNRLLSDLTRDTLARNGFETLEHRQVPCNDGGLVLGQALVAAHTFLRDSDPSGSLPATFRQDMAHS